MNKSDNKWKYILVGLVLIVVAVVSIVLFFINGQTSYTASDGETKTVESISCNGKNVDYPIFAKNDNLKESEAKVNMIMNNEKLDTISFVYRQSFKDNSLAKSATTQNKIAMDTAFSDDNLDMNSLGRIQSTLDDVAQLSLYTERKDLSNLTAKYFLLEDAAGSYKKDTLLKIYNNHGLKCTISQ